MTAQFQLVFPAGSQPVATSEDAADKLTAEELNARRMRVLRMFASVDGGLTADEVVRACGGGANSWAPRVTELRKLGLLDRLDGKDGRRRERRKTRAGGTGFVHCINHRGRRFLEP